jgi:periplasmic protein TonB
MATFPKPVSYVMTIGNLPGEEVSMPRELFGEVSNPRVEIGSRSRYTLPVSIALHVVILGIVLLAPLMAPTLVPTPASVMIFAAPAPPPSPPPPPPAPAAEPMRAAAVAPREGAAPISAPLTIAEELPAPAGVPRGMGVPGGVEGGIDLPGVPVSSVVAIPEPPAPPPVEPVRPGGKIKVPEKTRHVPPVYPAIAQQAGVEGVVILEATIDVDGRVRDVRVLRSVPLLDQAAIDAVLQWRFTPTLLNGVPVPVIMTVTVNFTLREVP